MQITDDAKVIIENYLKQKNAEGLRLYTMPGGCGCSPQYALTTEPPQDSDRVEMVNGIRLAVAQEIEDTSSLTLDMEEYEGETGLVLLGAKSGCGCGGHH